MNLDLLFQLAVSGFLLGGVYSLIALGLSLIFGVMRVINFAHGEMMVWGCMWPTRSYSGREWILSSLS